ncbi:MAG: hypothetical protein JSV22_07260 [Bacteroidales bacterium]|nr:MAG: hypothetical protein JSV22_07260 [Bacteroidales bacterium]
MKSRNTKILLIIILICFINRAENIFGGNHWQGIEGKEEIEDIYNEKFYLMTDRTIYATGEKILFKIFNISPDPLKSIHWSKVIYLELTKDNGSAVQKAKYPLGYSGAKGYMVIPAKISSGYYYLRAYTKWMRNFPVSNFAFCRIKIINPFSAEIQEIKNAENGSISYAESFINETLKENIISCYTDKEIYTNREKVTLSVELPEDAPHYRNEFCISVIKPGTLDTINYGMLSFNKQVNDQQRLIEYIPDIRGVSVSGRVVEKGSGNPVNNTSVQLSILGNQFDFLKYNTGPDGKYIFSLPPLEGKKDMYIAARAEDTKPEILIDNDFTADAFYIKGEMFRLSDSEVDIAEEIMFNMQIERIYKPWKTRDSLFTPPDTIKRTFYSDPARIVFIDEYIELPTVEEVLFELVPEVIVKRRKDNILLRVTNFEVNHPDLAIFEPLVLLDYIPVYNFENLLKLSPSKISRIEVLNEIFIKGTNRFGGIISIFSRKGDIAGVDLPENSLFFEYYTFTRQDDVVFPDYNKNKGELNIPDYRNCLYWNPGIKLDNNMKAGLEFFTSDRKGKYMVVVRSATGDGQIIEGKCTFRVK